MAFVIQFAIIASRVQQDTAIDIASNVSLKVKPCDPFTIFNDPFLHVGHRL